MDGWMDGGGVRCLVVKVRLGFGGGKVREGGCGTMYRSRAVGLCV